MAPHATGGSTAATGHGVEVGPHAGQAGIGVFQLGQIDLELGLVGLGPGGEDVQDQLAAVQNLDLDDLFQLADLGGREVVVEDDDIAFKLLDTLGQLLGLAPTDVGGRVDGTDLLLKAIHHQGPGTLGQGGQFGQIVVKKPPHAARQRPGWPFPDLLEGHFLNFSKLTKTS